MAKKGGLVAGSSNCRKARLALVGSLVLCAGWAAGVRAAQVPKIQDKLAEIRRLMDSGDWKRADELTAAGVSQNRTSYHSYAILPRLKNAHPRNTNPDTAYHPA